MSSIIIQQKEFIFKRKDNCPNKKRKAIKRSLFFLKIICHHNCRHLLIYSIYSTDFVQTDYYPLFLLYLKSKNFL